MSGPKPKHRGTIILDASALIDLCAEVTPTLRQHGIKPVRYLETITFLARQGYRVIIPEMVSIEASSVLANGTALNSKFDNASFLPSALILTPLLRDAALPAGDARKEHPGLEIMPHTGPAEVDAFCQQMTDACNKPKLQTARYLIMQARKTNTSNFGDKSILSLLDDPAKHGIDEPVIVIARDGFLSKSVREFSHQPTYTPSKLAYALGSSRLASHLGFVTNVSGDALRDDFYRASVAFHRTPYERDAPHALTDQEVASLKQPWFYDSLRTLAQELGRAQPEAEAKRGARTMEFNLKYARFKGAMKPKAARGNDEPPGR